MENIINTPYKRKNTTDSDIFVVDRIENEFVIFKNNARCSLTMLQTDFEPVNENYEHQLEPIIDPNTFFDTPMSESDALLDQVESAIKNPSALPQHSDRLKESVPIENNIQSSGLINRLDGDQQPQLYNDQQPTIVNEQPSNRLPEWDVFDRVKKAEEIEILVPFKIKLPRPEKIDALNDMFETSFTMYLAKQYIKDNVINNSIPIQKMIQAEIENWMESELYGTKKKRVNKPKAKEKPKTVVENINEEIVEKVKEVASKSEDSAMSFFNVNQPVWDKDLKKLFIINTEEQYIAVEKELNRLKDSNSKSTNIDKYEEMILTYKENNQ